jgi:hypothetical protein
MQIDPLGRLSALRDDRILARGRYDAALIEAQLMAGKR